VKRYADIPDAVVVEGPKAGGHLGFKEDQIEDPDFALERILPDVVAVVKLYEDKFRRNIPVIAAGGVFTGTDIYRLFKLGAGGVQLGTRFVATHECDADIRFKQAYVSCREADIVIIKSPVGMPGRAIKSRFLKDIMSSKKMKLRCAWKCLESCDIKTARYCISLALDNARKGILEKGFAFAGSNAFRINHIISVKELLQELQTQYLRAGEKGAGRLRSEYERALEKIGSAKAAYLTTLKSGFNSLKDEYEKNVEIGVTAFREEYLSVLDKINSLKAEYLKAVDNANCLKEELIMLFEQYSLFNRLQAEQI
jgi:nitronate monooxygenase